MTVTMSTKAYQRIVQNEMAVTILKGLVKDKDYILVDDVKRILDAVDENEVAMEDD